MIDYGQNSKQSLKSKFVQLFCFDDNAQYLV